MIAHVVLDSGDQFRHAAECPAADALVGDLAKPALDQVQPGTRSRSEMQMEPGMAPDPGLDLRMFVGSIVVHDQVQVRPVRCFAIDLFEELDELLMPVTRHTVADHFAIDHTQGGR